MTQVEILTGLGIEQSLTGAKIMDNTLHDLWRNEYKAKLVQWSYGDYLEYVDCAQVWGDCYE